MSNKKDIKTSSKTAKRSADITGRVFGTLTAIERDEEKTKKYKNGAVYWKCKCECGKEKSISIYHLLKGAIVTCGDRKAHWSGENNTNWKGGITPEIQSARTSKEYAEWRKQVYALDHYTCQCCLKSKGIKKEAHHIYNFSDYKELRYNPVLAMTLCYDCHSMYEPGSFHHTYGTRNNTPEQLEEYINNKRKELGIIIPFSINEYIKDKKASRLSSWINKLNSDPIDEDWEADLVYELNELKEPKEVI